MAAGATLFAAFVTLLSLATMLYAVIMPILIFLRLGRIARAAEASTQIQKDMLLELNACVAGQNKLGGEASVHTMILKNVDQNLALAINKALPRA